MGRGRDAGGAVAAGHFGGLAVVGGAVAAADAVEAGAAAAHVFLSSGWERGCSRRR